MKTLHSMIRPHLWSLLSHEVITETGGCSVRLDLGEHPYNAPFNHYPDPHQTALRTAMAAIRGVEPAQTFVAGGTDELIDLLLRAFCEPGRDNVVTLCPTRHVYARRAAVNNVATIEVPLNDQFQLDASKVLAASGGRTKLIFICSPNSPTGNSLSQQAILRIVNGFDGLVVIDESYGGIGNTPSFRTLVGKQPGVVVLESMSHAWGAAALRIGFAYASADIVDVLRCLATPYRLSTVVMEKAMELIADRFDLEKMNMGLVQERDRLMEAFRLLPTCEQVYASDAPFFLARMSNAPAVALALKERGIAVRLVTVGSGNASYLRIGVGMKSENNALMSALRQIF